MSNLVLMAAIKGGVGKSTMACNIATYLAHNGNDVMLLDTDRQATAKNWLDRRAGREDSLPVIHSAQIVDGDVVRPTQDLMRRYGMVVADCPGGDSRETRRLIGLAHTLIVPTRASVADLETLAAMDELVDAIRDINPGLRAYAVLSMAPTNPMISEVADAQALLADFPHLQLHPVVIRDRKAYRDTLLAGIGVVEGSNSQAAAEIQLLCQNLFTDNQNI